MRINGEGSIEVRARCVYSVEDLSDLELLPLNLIFAVFGAWHTRPPPEGPFNFFYDPGVVW